MLGKWDLILSGNILLLIFSKHFIFCNRLLKLGRPVGAVTLSRWEWWWNERWIWGARGGVLNLISTNYPDHGHHGRLPLSRKNAYGRTGNRTRDLMVSSQELWPPGHEAGQVYKHKSTKENLFPEIHKHFILLTCFFFPCSLSRHSLCCYWNGNLT